MSLLTTSVSDLTQECFAKFNDAMGKAKIPGAQDPLDSRLADFNLWVDNVGAMAKSGASLDSRFRTRADDLALVKNILSMLSDFLVEYADTLQDCRLITEALVNIDSSIRNLALIGVAIRRTGKASRSRRANQSFNPDEHHEFRRHLECLVLLRPSEGKSPLDLDISNVDNISKVNKLMQSIPAEVSGPNDTFAPGLAQAVAFTTPEPKSQQTKSQTLLTVTGFSTASTAEGTLQFNLARKRQPTPVVARSQISFIAANTEFPKPPSSSQHQRVFRCPCCCQSLPSEEFASPNRWKQHLIEDLCPYTCIAQSCPTPDLTFTTRKAWELHIENDHPPQWQCLLCDGDDEPFPSKDDITTHIGTQHLEELSNYTLSSLVSWAEVRYIGIRSCPLCSSYGPRDSPELVDHAVRHAYEFALRALPWPKLALEDLDKPIGTYYLPEDVSDVERLDNWLGETSPDSANKLEVSPFDKADHGFQENADHVVVEDYFANDDYFEDQASADSSKRQTAQGRSSMRLSEPPDEDLSRQHTQIQSNQSEAELMATVRDGNVAAVQHLMANIYYENCTILYRKNGNLTATQYLIENGIDVNARDENGQTALFGAVEKQDKAIIKHLIESGIIDIKDGNGRTALFLAMEDGISNGSIIELLLTKDVYENFRNHYGQTPLSWARSKNKLTMVHRLSRWLQRTPMLAAQDIYNFEDYAAVTRNVKQGDDWFGVFNPLERVLDIELVDTLKHTRAVHHVAFSHDGEYLATGGDTVTQIFDIGTRGEVCVLGTSVRFACFSPDGQSLATAGNHSKKVQVWDIATKTARHTFYGHTREVSALYFSHDGRLVASGSHDRTVRIWDIEQSVQVQEFETNDTVESIAISPDTCFVAAGCDNSKAYIWNLKTDALNKNVHELGGHGDVVDSVSFSSDSKYLVTGSRDQTVKVWDLDNGTCLKTLVGHLDTVLAAVMTPDDRWIVSASLDGSVRFWDPTTGTAYIWSYSPYKAT
ncbi:hypothetical protein ACHAQJ_001773 [Trichoderma viride]